MKNPTDARGVLEEEIFACQITKDQKMFISWHGRRVTALRGVKARRFIADIENAEGRDAQLMMAKATGHFKHGNERMNRG